MTCCFSWPAVTCLIKNGPSAANRQTSPNKNTHDPCPWRWPWWNRPCKAKRQLTVKTKTKLPWALFLEVTSIKRATQSKQGKVKIQTHKRLKQILNKPFIRTKHNMHIFGVIPFTKPQTTLKWWTMSCRTKTLACFWLSHVVFESSTRKNVKIKSQGKC